MGYGVNVALKNAVSKNIWAYRLKDNLTQEALARAVGSEPSYLNVVDFDF